MAESKLKREEHEPGVRRISKAKRGPFRMDGQSIILVETPNHASDCMKKVKEGSLNFTVGKPRHWSARARIL